MSDTAGLIQQEPEPRAQQLFPEEGRVGQEFDNRLLEPAMACTAGPETTGILPEIPLSPTGDWECPCGRENAFQPTRTIVALREPFCRFCGKEYCDEYRRWR